MDMIRGASGGKQPRVVVSQDSAHVSEQSRFDFRRDESLPMFGGEDEMNQKAGEGLRHLINLSCEVRPLQGRNGYLSCTVGVAHGY